MSRSGEHLLCPGEMSHAECLSGSVLGAFPQSMREMLCNGPVCRGEFLFFRGEHLVWCLQGEGVRAQAEHHPISGGLFVEQLHCGYVTLPAVVNYSKSGLHDTVKTCFFAGHSWTMLPQAMTQEGASSSWRHCNHKCTA